MLVRRDGSLKARSSVHCESAELQSGTVMAALQLVTDRNMVTFTKVVAIEANSVKSPAVVRSSMQGTTATLQVWHCQDFYTASFQTPLASQEYSHHFSQAFQVAGSSSHRFHWKPAAEGQARLEWRGKGQGPTYQCELTRVLPSDWPGFQKTFEEAASGLCRPDEAQPSAVGLPANCSKLLQDGHKRAETQGALLTACSKLLQSRARVITRLQQRQDGNSAAGPVDPANSGVCLDQGSPKDVGDHALDCQVT